MRNKLRYVLLTVILLTVTVSGHAYYHKLFDEPFINLNSSKPVGKGGILFSIQHNYNDYKISSANLKLGYGIMNNLDLCFKGLYHEIESVTNSQVYQLGIKEYGIEGLYSVLNESDNKIAGLSAVGGISRFGFRQKVNFTEFVEDRTYYYLQLLLSKNVIDLLLINVSPALIYDGKENKIVSGLLTGFKINYKEKIALVLEYPLILNNPYNWLTPWSAGIQFHTGPHVVTLFITNTYGFTVSNILQGLDRNFIGFRYTF